MAPAPTAGPVMGCIAIGGGATTGSTGDDGWFVSSIGSATRKLTPIRFLFLEASISYPPDFCDIIKNMQF